MKKIILFRNEASPDDPIIGYDRIERRYITMSECLGIESSPAYNTTAIISFDRVDGTPIRSGDIYVVRGDANAFEKNGQ